MALTKQISLRLGLAGMLALAASLPARADTSGQTATAMPLVRIAPLIEAAAFGQPNSVAALLAEKTDLNATDLDGHSALALAAAGGHVTISKMLIEAGAKVEQANVRAETPLWLAAAQGHTAVVRLLIAKGAVVEHRSAAGLTALAISAQRCHDGSAAALIKGGAAIMAAPQPGQHLSPLMFAVTRCDEKILGELLVDKNAAKALMAVRDNLGRTALWLAADIGNASAVAYLLRSGAQIADVDNNGETALHRAISHPEVLSILLAHGAQVSVVANDGNTPLIRAAALGKATSIKALLTKGASVNHRNRLGQTALMMAATTDNAEIVDMLLQAGANRSLRNVRREAARDIALQYGHTGIASRLR